MKPEDPASPPHEEPQPENEHRSDSTGPLKQRAEAAELEVDRLTRALHSRPDIEQAKGVLMAVYGISADDAFQALVTVSQNANIKLTTVASRFLIATQEIEFGTTIRDKLFAALSSVSRPEAPYEADTRSPGGAR